METKKEILLPVIVEGRYDKATILSIFSGRVYTTEGFGVFRDAEKRALLRRIAEPRGVILLVDPDGGGRQIRSYLSGILPKEKIHHLYIPEIAGKERRKDKPSKAGLLGVEGMDRETLERVFAPFLSDAPEKPAGREISLSDFLSDGFSGGKDAAARRDALAARFSLPSGMSAKALLSALNFLSDFETYSVERDKISPEKP